jgi:hypothetical protein
VNSYQWPAAQLAHSFGARFCPLHPLPKHETLLSGKLGDLGVHPEDEIIEDADNRQLVISVHEPLLRSKDGLQTRTPLRGTGIREKGKTAKGNTAIRHMVN